VATCAGTEVLLHAVANNLDFLWSTGDTASSISVTPVEDVLYSVVASNAYGCADTAAVMVKAVAYPVLSIQSDDTEICTGESTTLVAEGGSSYLWSTGDAANSITVAPLADLAYSLTASNGAGCADTASVMIKVHPLPTASILSHIAEICAEDTAQLVAQGGVTYLWSTGDSGSVIAVYQPEDYSVTAINEFGCSDVSTVTIASAGDLPVADFNFVLSNDSVRFENLSVNADDYFWTVGDSASGNDAQPQHIFSPGVYKVCLVATNICGADSVCKTVTITSSGDLRQAQASVNVYAEDHALHVRLANNFYAIESIQLFSAAGQEIISMQLKPGAQSAILNTTGLAAGIYLCSVNLSNGEKVVKRVSVR
jgi:PKD repeat protein